MKIELEGETVDKIIVEDLKWVIRNLLDPSNDRYETIDNKATEVAAFFKVLKHYTTQGEYDEFVSSLKGKIKNKRKRND